MAQAARRVIAELRDGPAADGTVGVEEPNTHLVIERIFELRPALRYIHFTRHPLDLALVDNQSQLQNWGPILLNRDVEANPRASLAYVRAVHERTIQFLRRHSERTLTVDFDALCTDPHQHCARIAEFLSVGISDRIRADFGGLVDEGRARRGRYKTADLGQFNPQEIAYFRELGYDVD